MENLFTLTLFSVLKGVWIIIWSWTIRHCFFDVLSQNTLMTSLKVLCCQLWRRRRRSRRGKSCNGRPVNEMNMVRIPSFVFPRGAKCSIYVCIISTPVMRAKTYTQYYYIISERPLQKEKLYRRNNPTALQYKTRHKVCGIYTSIFSLNLRTGFSLQLHVL